MIAKGPLPASNKNVSILRWQTKSLMKRPREQGFRASIKDPATYVLVHPLKTLYQIGARRQGLTSIKQMPMASKWETQCGYHGCSVLPVRFEGGRGQPQKTLAPNQKAPFLRAPKTRPVHSSLEGCPVPTHSKLHLKIPNRGPWL